MEVLGEAKTIFYFQYKGEGNTIKVLELAKARALELGIEKMVWPRKRGAAR